MLQTVRFLQHKTGVLTMHEIVVAALIELTVFGIIILGTWLLLNY